MEFFQVLKYGATTKEIKKVNPLKEEISVPSGVTVYFVNTKFSDPSYGFIMTADGVVTTLTMGCELTGQGIRKYAELAKQAIADGKVGDLNLKFKI